MKFLNLEIRMGEESKKYDFKQLSVIWSENNRSGKSTLLRCLLYSIGYSIPSPRGLDFSRVIFRVRVETENGEIQEYVRKKGCIERIRQNEEEMNTVLSPDEVIEELTGIKNKLLLANLLGAFYLDQDRGWTLLNRGKVIGGIKFCIEDFVCGLGGGQCEDERRRLALIEEQEKKYEQVLYLAKYQKQVRGSCGEGLDETPFETAQKEALRCQNLRMPLMREFNRIQRVIRDNNNFKRYVTSFSIIVKSPSGEEFPVTEETIVGFEDNQKLLEAKKRDLQLQIVDLDKKIAESNKKAQGASLFVDIEANIQQFDSQIARINIDTEAVERSLLQLKREHERIKAIINRENPSLKEIELSMESVILSYLSEFSITDPKASNLYTSDLKALGGTGLHLIVFAFRLAYVKVIRDQFGCVLPIIIDSPHGREVKNEVVTKMLEVLLRDFKQHQIIIATIFDPKIEDEEIIQLKHGVFGDGPLFDIMGLERADAE